MNMNRLVLFVGIVGREEGERCVSILSAQGAGIVLISAGHGTASNDMLSILGLDQSEKDVIFAVLRPRMTQIIMQKLIYRMNIVAFTVPVASVVSALTFKEYFSDNHPEQSEGDVVVNTQYSAIVVILNRGYLDPVMEVARKAGATGGTLIHAKGASTRAKEKFFGVSFAEEKEMIFIVADNLSRAAIMKAIVNEAGIQTKAKAMVFALPVHEIAGFTGLSSDDMD